MGHRERMRPEKLAQAKAMRANPTRSEALLWNRLRARQLDGWKFTRQARIGGYIVDFYAPQAGLIVEVDGPIHDDPQHQLGDAHRDAALRGYGYRVLHVPSESVEADIEPVVRRIRTALAEPPTPYWAGR